MTARDLDLLVVGEVNPDVVVRDPDPRPVFGQAERLVETVELTVGSSSAIFACAAARLGLRVGLVGVVGDDELGRFMLRALAERGVDVTACRVDPTTPTGASVILSGGTDRAILTALGTIGAVRVDDVSPGLLARARHLHVGSYYLQAAARPGLPALFRQARGLGLSTSVDGNWDPTGRWDGGLRELLAATDLFFPNEVELARLTGTDDPADGVARLAADVPGLTIAVKLGPDGGLVRGSAGAVIRRPALPITAIDTTGAGDAFDAGFLLGWLERSPLDRCLELAVGCGSLSTLGVGGVAAQPDRATLEAATAAAPR
jgi:sugar/nucleoside kinase (ribokinase family)